MDALRFFGAALLVALAAAAAGCGDDSGGSSRNQLEWLDAPTVVVPPALKSDRVLRGDVRNDSDSTLRLEAARVRVLDQRGRPLKSSATFAAGYLHSLYPPTRGPESLPDTELERLGRIARIDAGDTTQITVSWRVRPGRAAAQIDYGSGSLQIPADASKAAGRDF